MIAENELPQEVALDQRNVTLSDAQEERLPFLDGLRVLALFAVALSYLAALAPAVFGGANSPLSRVLGAGSHGLDLFFALSGFCLAYPVLLVLRYERAVGFQGARYAAGRIARIAVPYVIALAVLAAVPLVAGRMGHPFPLGDAVGPWDLVRQFFFLDYGTKFTNPSFWAICL